MQTRHRIIPLAIIMAFAALTAAAPGAAEEPDLPWQAGPGTMAVGSGAEIDLPEGFAFLDAAGTQEFMRMNHNPTDDNDVATIVSGDEKSPWFMVFEWDPLGFVKDSDADKLDPEAILESIRSGTEAANEARQEKGWPPLTVVGWQERPRYDPASHNLTWSIIGESEGNRSINRNTRLLGRYGVMSAVLVCDPENLAAASQEADQLLQNFRYKSGSRYAEFLPGTDKVAEYGLVALVAGGAGAALVKSGLLAKLWKPLVALAFGAIAVLRRLFGGKSAPPTA